MVNYRVITALVMVVLIFTCFSLILSNNTKKANLEKATVLGDVALEYLDLIDNRCRGAKPNEYEEIVFCLDQEITKAKVDVDLEEDEYKNKKNNEPGYVVLVNEGRKSLDSNLFTLTKNHEVVDIGCVIEGSIDPGYSCRMNFNSSCDPGDVLEISYGENRAYLKTC